jgi:hypothetical protein
MDNKIINIFNKNAREKVRVMLTTYQGRDLIDVRSCVEGEGGTLIPTRKGITMSIDLIKTLKESLEKATDELKSMNLLK